MNVWDKINQLAKTILGDSARASIDASKLQDKIIPKSGQRQPLLGYKVDLIFLKLNSVEEAIISVANRIAQWHLLRVNFLYSQTKDGITIRPIDSTALNYSE